MTQDTPLIPPEMPGEPVGITTDANTSGQPDAVLPAELQGLNWGAFLMGALWAIFNKAWLGLVACLICSGLGNIYILLKGNELAWKSRRFSSIQEFKDVQKAWLKWGIILAIVGAVIGVISGIIGAIIGFSNR